MIFNSVSCISVWLWEINDKVIEYVTKIKILKNILNQIKLEKERKEKITKEKMRKWEIYTNNLGCMEIKKKLI